MNNAGICVCGEFEWLTWKQIQRQVEVNLLGTMRVTKYCMPLLKSAQGKLYLELAFVNSSSLILSIFLFLTLFLITM